MDDCDRCGEYHRELYHNDHFGGALCERCDRIVDSEFDQGDYVVFAFYGYYPGGGWNDYYDRFKTLDEARASARQSTVCYDYWQIVNVTTGQILDTGGKA